MKEPAGLQLLEKKDNCDLCETLVIFSKPKQLLIWSMNKKRSNNTKPLLLYSLACADLEIKFKKISISTWVLSQNLCG